MPADDNSAAALRARLQHHTSIRDRAQAERAELIGAKADAGALLSDADLDEADSEIARLADVVERAGSRIALLGPALAAAETAEAQAAERRAALALADQDRQVAAGMASTFGREAGAAAGAAISAAKIRPRPINQGMFDEPRAPIMTRDDAAFWEARDRREREERAARTHGIAKGTLRQEPAEPTYAALRHHG